MGRVPDRIFCEIIGYIQTFRKVKKTEQRSIVLDLARKGLSPLAIYYDLIVTTRSFSTDANTVVDSEWRECRSYVERRGL
jgi:hypothetical protein